MIEGPAYADRVRGRLTFRDWEHWTAEDRAEYRELFEARLMAGHPSAAKAEDWSLFNYLRGGPRRSQTATTNS
jgi:hypothetical protein